MFVRLLPPLMVTEIVLSKLPLAGTIVPPPLCPAACNVNVWLSQILEFSLLVARTVTIPVPPFGLYVTPFPVAPVKLPAPLTMLQVTVVLLAPDTLAVNACDRLFTNVEKFFGAIVTCTVLEVDSGMSDVLFHAVL
jgi:hypothetical protein